MNESNLPGLSSFGWDTLKIFIGNILFEIPDNSILSQLICDSIPDRYFITHILSQHNLLHETGLKVENILETSTTTSLWQDIKEAIYEDRNIDQTKRRIYDQLYVTLSLLDCRKSHDSQSRTINMPSMSILKEFSNLAIKNIRYDLRHPLKSDLITRSFCKEKCINHKILQYHELILKYFWNMTPQPFGSLSNYNKDSK
jgi:hypothetical protein